MIVRRQLFFKTLQSCLAVSLAGACCHEKKFGMSDGEFGHRLGEDRTTGVLIQEIWGKTTPEGLGEAAAALGEACIRLRSTRILMLVSRSDAQFTPAQFISMFEAFMTAFPSVRRIAYVLDVSSHDTEQMLLGTLAWRHQIKVGFHDDEKAALAWLGRG